jgi:hypothetical protein
MANISFNLLACQSKNPARPSVVIPNSMHIKRAELQPARKEKATYTFPNGNFDNLELQWFRGMPVAVRKFSSCVLNEAKTVLSLPSHPCFPVLFGVCCEEKPYILVTPFYGNVKKGVYMSLQGLYETDGIALKQWISIFIGVAGLMLMHSSGFAHGEVTAENMLKKKRNEDMFIPVFLNLVKAEALDKIIDGCKYKQDYSMFASLVEMVITSHRIKDHANSQDLSKVSQLTKIIYIDHDLYHVVKDLKSMLHK